MKVTTHIFSQALRLIDADPALLPANAPGRVMQFIRGLQERYGFLQAPVSLEPSVFEQGATFAQGVFQDRVRIDQVKVFNNGVVCDSRGGTVEDCDKFLDDAIGWVNKEFDARIYEPRRARGYFSQIEVQSDFPLEQAFEVLAPLGKAITKKLRSYGQTPHDFKVSGITMHSDIAQIPIPRPGSFAIERRTEQPYEKRLYFCQAPLTTADHLEALNEFEQLASRLAANAS